MSPCDAAPGESVTHPRGDPSSIPLPFLLSLPEVIFQAGFGPFGFFQECRPSLSRSVLTPFRCLFKQNYFNFGLNLVPRKLLVTCPLGRSGLLLGGQVSSGREFRGLFPTQQRDGPSFLPAHPLRQLRR